MTIWILAILIIGSAVLAGWRQGAIRAAFTFAAIIFAALLAVPVGGLIRPLLPHLGAHNPVTAWALAPVVGFLLASIPFWVAGQMVHRRFEHHYKYHAGELQQALYSRLNTRLGICIGVINGAAYFVLVSFFIFNAAYWTTQVTKDPGDPSDQPLTMRLVSYLGEGLQSSGFSKTASAVGRLSPMYYRLADFAGRIVQNPQLTPRMAQYPGLISFWHRDDMQPLVTDANLVNALTSGTTLGEITQLPSVQSFFGNPGLIRLILVTVTNNLDDLTLYLKTGQSAKYGNEPILGNWNFDAPVTLAWFRQAEPKIPANEMAAVRALWTQAYGPTTLLMTGDNKIYVKNWPKFVQQNQQNQPPFQPQDGQGDWSRDGANYTLHINVNGEDKYLSGTTDGLRLKLKDRRSQLIFDHVN